MYCMYALVKAGDGTKNRRRRSTSSLEPPWFEELRQAGRSVVLYKYLKDL